MKFSSRGKILSKEGGCNKCNKEQGSIVRNEEVLAKNVEVPTPTTLKRIPCQI
jgi:hypothetical protein